MALSSPDNEDNTVAAAAFAVCNARTTPLPEIGSTASAASPTASQRLWQRSVRCKRRLTAENTRGPHFISQPATLALVKPARLSASDHCGMRSPSVISITTERSFPTGAEYHQPSGVVSTSV